ncbi:MAG TPA: polysaccharide pyruvyl transferase family protein [Acidimicrobiales bacterium]|nr:polysaccharide pyruvyl transferase family protein [Acidimicrobiales bacterium]
MSGTAPGSGSRLRIGIFGRLGSGNIGNDASLEAVLGFLRSRLPQAEVDALCFGPRHVTAAYGIPAVGVSWYAEHGSGASGVGAALGKVVGKAVDLVRTAAWVRRHDAVIVPGMGVLETSLPVRASEFPYALFLVSALGRVFGTRVALVCVGAGEVHATATRWLLHGAARLAAYRSYRDDPSARAMHRAGRAGDPVYCDLAFSLAAPACEAGDAGLVGVGVMAYRGSNDDRSHAEQVYAEYVTEMEHFVTWLLDRGRRVRLVVGDTNGSDQEVVAALLERVRAQRPGLEEGALAAVAVSSLADVMEALRPVGTVVAIRYHNLVGALMVGKPTLAVGYAPKHDALLAELGLAGFCLPVRALGPGRLQARFEELERRAGELRPVVADRRARCAERLEAQFTELAAVLGAARPDPAMVAR